MELLTLLVLVLLESFFKPKENPLELLVVLVFDEVVALELFFKPNENPLVLLVFDEVVLPESFFWPNENPLELLVFDEVAVFESFFRPNESSLLFGKPPLLTDFLISFLRVKWPPEELLPTFLLAINFRFCISCSSSSLSSDFLSSFINASISHSRRPYRFPACSKCYYRQISNLDKFGIAVQRYRALSFVSY